MSAFHQKNSSARNKTCVNIYLKLRKDGRANSQSEFHRYHEFGIKTPD